MKTRLVSILAGLAFNIFSGVAFAQQQPSLTRTPEVNVSRDLLPLIQKNLQLNLQGLSGFDPNLKDRLSASVRLDVRIVGGEPLPIERSPWQVALVRGYVPEPARYQFCGGSVIAPNWIVTAAHCIKNSIVQTNPSRVSVVAGTAFYEVGGERLEVDKLFVHPSYVDAGQGNDIALLKLKTASTRGVPIALVAPDGELRATTPVSVSGWGALFEGGQGSKELLGVTMPVVSSQVCNAPEVYSGQITDTMFCAGEREGGIDSCQGDSGGPVWATLQNTPSLVGIVSWGEGCARRLKYGVYTRVSAMRGWVDSTMNANR
jgi:secreted trypsin-like serine protease